MADKELKDAEREARKAQSKVDKLKSQLDSNKKNKSKSTNAGTVVVKTVTPSPQLSTVGKSVMKAALSDYFAGGYSPHSDLIPMQALMNKGLTKDGIMWMVNYLDPCGEHAAQRAMIPDSVSGSRVLKPQTFDFTIKTHADFGSDSWDLAILSLPFIEAPFLTIRKKVTESWPDIAAATWDIRNPESSKVAMYYLPEYKDSGNYTTKQATHHRLVARGTTTNLTGPLLERSGEVFSGQFPPEIEWISGRIPLSFAGASEAQSSVIISPSTVGQVAFRLPPTEPTSIMQVDRLAYRGPATEGCYLPLRANTPSGIPEFRSTLQGGEFNASNHSNTSYNNEKAWYHSTHHLSNPGSDWNIGVTVYTGLNSKEVVTVKMRGYQEFAPRADSPLAEMANLAPTPDLNAVKMASMTTHHLRHAYPASYNDLSGLLGVLGSVFKKYIRPTASALSGLGIPIVSPVAGVVDKVSSMFGL